MARYVFDIETDGLLDTLSKVHCLVMKDDETGDLISLSPSDDIEAGVKKLQEADALIGHNIIKYDIPALKKIYPWFEPKGRVIDTLVCTRLIFPEVKQQVDFRLKEQGRLPGRLMGSHSLEAWGIRIGNHKGEFGKTTDWSEWSQEMQDYCEEDVEVTASLWKKIQLQKPAQEALDLEHAVTHLMWQQQINGFPFNVDAAAGLYAQLSLRRQKLTEELKSLFQPWWVSAGEFMPKRDNKKQGYTAGVPMTKVKLVSFNPTSRDHIADRLQKLYGWQPTQFTGSGKPTIDDEVLKKLPYEPAKALSELFMLDKRIGQIAEGAQSWLKLVDKDGRIHGSVHSNGAVTGRATHSHPNIAQVPKASEKTPYGHECRALFHAPEPWVLVGADASGLELRCLAHFMARWDGGEYAKILLEGDIHAANQHAAGLPDRDSAKTFI